ncbi:alanine racemase [Mycobacterium sp. AMU20-3851]|jgi:D-serine deaminase-like pyridoxal phosphate-dependent protein|uniref:alanine racemase n=1 Tax=Mycobacterium sp. AMU20-3851 TaxID=3122055 RepID=UPI003754E262
MLDIETPALVVDLARLTSNIAAMADAARGKAVDLRPHAKTHKSIQIANLQMGAGAVGITVATVSEAESFADHGMDDILIAYPILPLGAKARRFRELLDRVQLRVGVDSAAGASAIARAADGRDVSVLIEIDSGQHRTGVPAAEAAALAVECDRAGLTVAGVFTHGGHAYSSPDAPGRAGADEGDQLALAARAVRDAGFDIAVVSAGSTPTWRSPRPPEVTEERPGTYVFGDRQQVALGSQDPDACSAWIAATVVSSRGDRLVIDAGSKALTGERPQWLDGYGSVAELGNAVVTRVSEHHGILDNVDTSAVSVGDVVSVLPNHICTAVNLFDEYVVVDDGRVTERWELIARGRNV